MKLAIMQPYLFPYIGYFQLINAVDKFIILDDVNFITRGWINRNRILVNGEEHLFSVPIKKVSQNKLIYDCELAEGNWKRKLLKTIEHSYKGAPFYNDCIDILSSIFFSTENNLSKWITFQLKGICNYLDVSTPFVDSSKLYSNNHLKGKDKIVDICKKERADIYYNSIGGKDLYDYEAFKKNNIELRLLSTRMGKYSQFRYEFVPSLSIIDVMMFNEKDKIIGFLNDYILE
jgi:hypothetical protein